MRGPFYIVGPTASGKSDIAARVAAACDAEVVGADAFQIYRGLACLTAQPDAATRALAPHHLIGAIDPSEEMSAAKFAELARATTVKIRSRGQNVIIVGGSGLYVRALTDGFSLLPPTDASLRGRLAELSLRELNVRLCLLDPETAACIERKNRRRVQRAVEICLLSGQRVSAQRMRSGALDAAGVFVFREREDLYRRINLRVEKMFEEGVIDEIRNVGELGPTAGQAIGVREIRHVLSGQITVPEAIARIQRATRQYAKRQLTWFRRQTKFEPLNLSQRSTAEAVKSIVQKARLSFAG